MRQCSPLRERLAAVGVASRPPESDDPGCSVDGLVPSCLAEPASVAELAAALAAASEAGAAVIPVGGGTQLGLGNPPRAADLALSTRRLNRVLEYEPANLVVSAEAGLTLGELQATLAQRGQFLPLDPPAASRATLGGLAATNAAGPRRLGYGSLRDLVIGIRVVEADGRVVKAGGKVVKNVAGYDLNKLYVGSLGTLGVVAEVTLKVAPIPADQSTLAAAFPGLEVALTAVRDVLRSTLQPLAASVLDPDTASRVGLGELAGQGAAVLAVLVAGAGPAVRRQLADLAGIAVRAGATATASLDAAATGPLWATVADLPAGEGGQAAVLCKAAVPPAAVLHAALALREADGALPAAPRLWAHAGSGIVYARWPLAHPTSGPGGDPSAVGERIERVALALGEARQRIAELGGSLVVESAPVALKGRLDVWGYAGDALPAMRALKARFDPHGTLNPGRFVGGI